MPEHKRNIRLGRTIYFVVTLAALAVVLWYFLPQYLELMEWAGAGE